MKGENTMPWIYGLILLAFLIEAIWTMTEMTR